MTGTPFPFVVGVARSGTTLLRLILDQHPDLAIPPESYFPLALLRRRRRWATAGGVDLGAFVEVLLADRSWSIRQLRETWGIDEDLLRSRLTGLAPSYADAVRSVYRLYADLREKPRYGDKTPAFLSEMPVLALLFPEARFVHVMRDGRDVATSLVEMRFGPRTIVHAAALWAEQVLLARADRVRVRALEVRYEDLVASPERVLRDVCAFLELTFSPSMLGFHEHAMTRLAAEAVPPENVRNLARPVTPGVRNWRQDMSAADRSAFEEVAGDVLADLGYEVAPGRRSPSARGRLVRTRVRTVLLARRSTRRALAGAPVRAGYAKRADR